jgi:hypothetical protein
MAKPDSDKDEVAEIRFTAGFNDPEDFVVLLERRASPGNMLSANVLMLHRSESLVNTVLKFAKKETATDMPDITRDLAIESHCNMDNVA